MRTTLKRGTGRPESNGRAAIRSSPLSAVSHYRGSRPGLLRVAVKVLFWVIVLLLMAGGALAGGAWLFINESVSAVRAHSPEAKEAEKFLDVPVPGEPTIAIVIGYDQRAGVDQDVSPRSDTIMLLRADPDRKTIAMLSFPRDMIVDIPGCDGQSPFRGRINEAYTACGPKGTLETVKELTDLPVNYMITVNFRGFKEIVDNVGGVYLDIDRRYFNDNSQGGPTYATINLRPGYQKLSGRQALDYVRYRHTDSDFFRIRRQQSFITAFKERVSGLKAVRELPGIVNAIRENVEVGVGGTDPLDFGTVFGYARLAFDLPTGSFHQIQIDPERFSGYAELTVSEQAVRLALEQFVTPDVKAAEKATNVATGRKPQGQQAPPPSAVTLEVLNGNGIAGAADEAGFLLARRGYQVVNGGNADNFNYFHTKVYYDPNQDGSRAAAKELAKLFGDGELERAEDALPVKVRVVLGQTFKNTLGPGAIDETPRAEPPAVVEDTTSALPWLEKAQRRVEFPVLAPTVRERSSSLGSGGLEPLRTYRLEGHDSIRLTYRLTPTDYWGIQQTTWTDAPILKDPNVVRKIKGREYKLFFNGPKLHMVAFEENDTAYWVVNTMLDRLSNETMLAIAQGLRPLGSVL